VVRLTAINQTNPQESRENNLIAIGVEVRVQWVSEIAVVSGYFKISGSRWAKQIGVESDQVVDA